MYTNNRDAYREAYYVAWQKYKKQMPLEPIESQLIQVILMHAEYQHLLEQEQINQEFAIEENPFFHMSLHLALHDQIQTNRPPGITELYQQLVEIYGDAHDVEHRMMECLANFIWRIQNGEVINEDDYLQTLKKILP